MDQLTIILQELWTFFTNYFLWYQPQQHAPRQPLSTTQKRFDTITRKTPNAPAANEDHFHASREKSPGWNPAADLSTRKNGR
jgi:hypothetical protein